MVSARVRGFLDSPYLTRAIQLIAVASLILTVAVGLRQIGLSSCLSTYADAQARSTAARAQAAAEDRKADEADRVAGERDRVAFRDLIAAVAVQDQTKSRTAFQHLLDTYAATDASRVATAKARADNEAKRQANPPPAPPSLKCS